MAFWKKSEDPWDREPTRTTYTTFEEESEEKDQTFLDEIREWREQKKAAAEAEEAAPPEKCPWCGKDMEKGYLTGGNGGYQVEWSTQKPGIIFGNAFHTEIIAVTDEGGMTSYKTCWYCRDCCKMTMEVLPVKPPSYTWEGGQAYNAEKEEEPLHDL